MSPRAPLRIVIADDSPTSREALKGILHQAPDLRVVGEAADGVAVVAMVESLRPDVVLMDVHMPEANGLDATRQIMIRTPTPIVIVSGVSMRDVDLSLTATQAGALLALPKPPAPSAPEYAQEAEQLRAMVRAMAGVKVVRHWTPRAPPRPLRRSAQAGVPRLVAVAASTGGPAALRDILGALPSGFPLPIAVVQHIARGFTEPYVQWLAAGSRLPVRIARDQEPLRAGVVYVAPDARHLSVTRMLQARLLDTPPIGGFRPSATCLFETAATAVGNGLIAVVLTGMGRDGVDGLERAAAAGATILVQDETTSVVFGMGHETVQRGLVHSILPLERIAPALIELSGNVRQ